MTTRMRIGAVLLVFLRRKQPATISDAYAIAEAAGPLV
jgi:hypothetical protein